MLFITLFLALIALYCAGMWGWLAWIGVADRRRLDRDDLIELERQTFHLGLCLILCLGFLGLIGGAH